MRAPGPLFPFHLALTLAVTLGLGIAPLQAASAQATATNDLLDLGLEDLMRLRVSVTTLTGRSQDLATAAAAAYVLTSEDIARSPARNVPDLLRTVPGIQVAQIDNSKWAISARSFNSRLASRLLVIVDGRNLYSPTFATVFWNAEDLPLDQIERIEVIRGPGATLWGANAVNGVIRITSKSSTQTQGTRVSLVTGNIDSLITELSHGGRLPAGQSFRVYLKLRERHDSAALDGGSSNDNWRAARSGFRLDSGSTGATSWSLQGDLYHQHLSQATRTALNASNNPAAPAQPDDIAQRGGNLAFNLHQRLNDGSQFNALLSYDYRQRHELILNERATITNLDLRWQNPEGSRHQLTVGAGYKFTDHRAGDTQYLALRPPEALLRTYGIGVYDDYALTDSSTLGVSLKAEHNQFTGLEYQPNLKFSHQFSDTNSVWTALTRAVRVPSRAEREALLSVHRLFPPSNARLALPVHAQLEPGPIPLDVETLISTEIGWRHTPVTGPQLDLSLFSNRHKGLRNLYLGTPRCEPDPGCQRATYVLQPLHVGNLDNADSYGVEAVLRQQLSASLALEASYTFLNMQYDNELRGIGTTLGNTLSAAAGIQRSFSAQLHWQIDPDRDTSVSYRYTGKPQLINIGAYHVVDLQYRQRLTRELQGSLMLRNLGARHVEFTEFLIPQPSGLVEPGIHVGLDWAWQP